MKNAARKERARLRAEAYASKPTDSSLLYGIVSASALLLVMLAFGAFYEINLWSQPLITVVLIALAFATGVVLRRLRMGRHRSAHRVEYDGDEAPHGYLDDATAAATDGEAK